MTPAELGLIRDEIGATVPPTNGGLEAMWVELGSGSWRLVALRVLRRRRADLSASEVSSVSLAGVASVSLRSNVPGMDRQIARLEAELAGEGSQDVPGARVARIHRVTAR